MKLLKEAILNLAYLTALFPLVTPIAVPLSLTTFLNSPLFSRNSPFQAWIGYATATTYTTVYTTGPV